MVYQKDRPSLRPRQILAEERKCKEDHAPACRASCPLHLDARSILAFVREGNFEDAFSIMEKTTYFPRILTLGCPGHCMSDCKREESGGGVNISAIEKAMLRRVEPRERQIKPYNRISLKVAVVGAGLAGLTAAAYLAEKGFQVSVFEKEKIWGRGLLNISGLTEEIIEADFAFLKKYIYLYFQTEIGKEIPYHYLFDAYDGIFLANGGSFENTGLTLDHEGHPVYDEATLQSSNPKVFAGGSAVCDSLSVTEAMAVGKKGAVSLDRFLKKVSLTASRPYEGVYQTELLVNVDDEEQIPPLVARDPSFGYTEEEAQEEASRCLDCHCTECVRGCKMLEQYGQRPRQYVRQIANNLIVSIGKRSANQLINSCTLCGLCGEVCSNSLNMGDICLSAREEMVRTKKMPLAIHDFPIRDMLFSNSGEFSFTRHAPGTSESRYLFFPGCQLSAGAPQYIRPLYDYLREKLPGDTGLFLGCCGAPAHWSGRKELFRDTVSQLKETWEKMGKPIVVTACTTCYQELKNIEGMELLTVWQCIDQYGLPEKAEKRSCKAPLSIHDPCTAREEPQIYESVRNILKKLDCPVEELKYSKDKTTCCGYGGLALFGNTEMTEAAIRDRVAQSPRDYLTYCWVCRDYLGKTGRKTTFHLLDLLFGEGKEAPYYDISDKRFNRRRLKEDLLKGLWHEDMDRPATGTMPRISGKPLMISDELRETLAGRLILVEDTVKAVEYGETSGNKVVRPRDNHYFTHYKPGIITYWVEYSETDESYILHNAYSHRLEILDQQSEEKT